ncbi:MAG: undecaprenyl-diphosphatase [Spirochaetes bacterium]|nr:MAG: undecaprenyl-diphosphatase [Spirochaetota bacterium]
MGLSRALRNFCPYHPLATFDVLLHVATLIVVVTVFKKRLLAIVLALWVFVFHKKNKDETNRENLSYVVPLLIATAITGVIGIAIEKFVPSGGPKEVSARMLVTAAILLSTLWRKPGTLGIGTMGKGRAAIVGIAQGIGVFSGISRSGISISAGLFAGLSREAAGEFSFILSIPAILGALLLTLGDLGEMSAAVSLGSLSLAFFAAMVSGFLSLKVLLKIVKGGKLYLFAPYLVAVGILGLLFA